MGTKKRYQCLYCGQQLDAPAAEDHWKECPDSSMRKEYEAMQILLRKIREELAKDPAIWTAELINEIDYLLGDEANGATYLNPS